MAKRRSSRSVKSQDLRFNIETERENDGRWIAEIADIPGVLAYGLYGESGQGECLCSGSAGDRRPCREVQDRSRIYQSHLRFGVSRWPSAKAGKVYKALLRIGWYPIFAERFTR